MVKLNLRVPYSQSVSKILVKPKILFVGYCEGTSSITELLSTYSKKLRIYIPRSSLVNPKYLTQFNNEDKKLIIRSEAVLKTLRPIVYDLNSLTYRLDKILYSGRSRINEKYFKAINAIFESLKLSDIKKEGYQLIPFQYLMDITKLSKKLSLGDLKYTLLGVLYAMFKDKKLPDIPFDEIILTLKISETGYVNYLVYDKKHFDIARILKIINSYVDLKQKLENNVDFEQIIQDKLVASNKIITTQLKVKDEDKINIIRNSLKQYYLKHPDQLDDRVTPNLIKMAVKESVEEAQEIEIKDIKFEKLLDEASKTIPPALVVQPTNEFSEVFNGEFQGGNALNFRSALFEKNLTDQLKIFAKYYETKYNMKVSNIMMKHKRSNSVFRTTFTELELTLVDQKTKKKHTVKLNIPDISDPNYIKQDGNKRVLLYQIYQYPIVQPFPFTSMLKTNYASIEFSSRIKNKHRGLYTYVAGQLVSTLTFQLIISMINCDKDPKCKGDCFEYTLKKLGAKYKISDDDKLLNSELYSIKFNNKIYYCPENGDQKTKQLFWAFKQEFKKHQFKDCAEYKDRIETDYGIRYLQKVQQIHEYIIDPITEFVLKSEKKSTNQDKIYDECISNALTGEVTSDTNLNNKRIRSSESLAIMIFKKITPAIDAYKHKHKPEIKVDQNIILNEMLTGEVQSQYFLVQDHNPLAEVGAVDMITYAGINGLNAEFAKDSVRMVDPTFYGNIDPTHTPDSSKVGVIRHLAVNSAISNSTGKFTIYDMSDEINTYSFADNYSPGPGHNDGNRIQYAAAQMQSDVPVKNAQLPYVASINSHLFSQVVSDDFIIKSPCNGKILKITDSEVIVKCNKQKAPVIVPYDKYKEHTNNTATTNEVLVTEGDTVIENQPIIGAEEFFKANNLALGMNLYTLLKPHGVYNYEDGIVVCESLLGKMASHHATQQVVVVKENEAITNMVNIGDTVEKNDVLIAKVAQLEEARFFRMDLEKEFVRDLMEFDDILSDDLQQSTDKVNEDNTIHSDASDDDPLDDSNVNTGITDSEDDEYSIDQFSKQIYPDIAGTVYDIKIFAKDENTLKKYPVLEKIRQQQIEDLKIKINEYKKEKFDTKPLERKLYDIENCFGLEYQRKKVENILIIFKIHGDINLGTGDKLHNRHGKLVAA